MAVIAAVAEFERDLLIERTQSGLKRAKAAGKVVGRPAALDEGKRLQVLQGRHEGHSLAQLAKRFGVSRAAIQRVEKRAPASVCPTA